MSPHGLAIARALARNGIAVTALDQNKALPSAATRFARVHAAAGINSEQTAAILLEQRKHMPADVPVVLYASSDNMVRSIAEHWKELEPYYRLSWAPSVDLVTALIDKSNLEHICAERDLLYPRSFLLQDVAGEREAIERVGLPILVKPIRPLSGFKAIRVNTADELSALVRRYQSDLPFLVQRWIPGADDSLYFCSMIVADGAPVAEFTGRKIEASPPGTGVGTIVESCPEAEVLELSRRFIQGLHYTGPIAIEYKRDPEGRFWLIEPNVGRTEYSVDLIIQAGINFPLIEYQMALGMPLSANTVQRDPVVWYDTDRDPLCYLRLCLRERTWRPRGKRRVFPYIGHGDWFPVARATLRFGRKVLTKAWNVLANATDQAAQVSIRRFSRFDEMPVAAQRMIAEAGRENPFYGPEWFKNYEHAVAQHEMPFFWACIYDRDGVLCGVWPLSERRQRGRRILRAMGNYYTPYATLVFDYSSEQASSVFRSALGALLRGVDMLEIEPVAPDNALALFLEQNKDIRWVDFERCTVNWFQDLESIDAYHAQLPGHVRSLLKRKQRALEKQHAVEYAIVRGNGEVLEHAVDAYFAVYAKSWKRQEPYPEFIRGLVRIAAQAGWLRLGQLIVDGEVVASQIWLVANRTAYIYKLAYDDNFGKKSVGSLLTWHLIQHVYDEDNVCRIDYLTGNDIYKRDWMECSRDLYTLTFVNMRRPLGALSYTKWRITGRGKVKTAIR